MRLSSITVLGMLFAISVACSDGGVDRTPSEVALRWIEDDPAAELGSSLVYDLEEIFEWSWADGSAPHRWRGSDLRLRVPKSGGLLAVVDGEHPLLDADVEIHTDDFQVLEIELRGMGRRPLELSWSGNGRELTDDPKRLSPASTEDREGATVYRFNPGDDPSWTGIVSGLRLTVPPGKRGHFRILAVRGLRRIVDPAWMADAVRRPHKINLGADSRNSLPAVPGTSHSRTLKVPPGASLTFSYGAAATIRATVEMRVEISPSGDDSTTTLFESTIGPAGPGLTGRWHEADIDLASFAGREVTISLATDSDRPVDPRLGVPAWANPEIVAPSAVGRPPNVILICLDTLRADGLSSYGNPLPTSPNIDAWAGERGVLFANAVAPAPWTLPSHASLFTGLDAVRHGVNFSSGAPPELEMIAERLRRHGYTTGAVTGGGYLGNSFGFIQGFDTFTYWSDEDTKDELKWVTEQTLDWLDARSHLPFFLFVHTYEVHYPHRRRQPFFNRLAEMEGADPPEGAIQMRKKGWRDLVAEGDHFVIRRPGSRDWVEGLTGDEIEMVRLMYDSAVAYTDTKVSAILDRLAELGIAENTMVILTSDHGEALGEDGRAGHYYLDDFNVMVPLIIEFPGGVHAGARVDRQVRLVDLTPTILETVGLPVPPELDGRSLVGLASNEAVDHPDRAWTYAGSSNRGLGLRIDNRIKYVFPDAAWSELAWREALYDLETDPNETTDLIDEDPRRDELRATTRETILEQHEGYRLAITNGSSSRLRGRLTGRWARHDLVKIADHGCSCIRWKDEERASFDLGPGQRVELLFAETRGTAVGLTGRLTGAGRPPSTELDLDFELGRIGLPAAIRPVGDGWELVEGADGPPDTGFHLRLVGELTPRTGDDPPPDDATIEQLRALGYVQ